MEGLADLGGDFRRVNFHGVEMVALRPQGRPESRTPLGHERHFVRRDGTNALQAVGPVIHHHLALHASREDFAGELLGIHCLAVQVEVKFALGEVETLLERQHALAGEPCGKRRTEINLLELLQRVLGHQPGAVGARPKAFVMRQDMATVLGQAHIHLGPLQAVFDAAHQGRARVLGRLAGLPAMRHDLKRSGRLDRLEEREVARAAGGAPCPSGETQPGNASPWKFHMPRELQPALEKGNRPACPKRCVPDAAHETRGDFRVARGWR